MHWGIYEKHCWWGGAGIWLGKESKEEIVEGKGKDTGKIGNMVARRTVERMLEQVREIKG